MNHATNQGINQLIASSDPGRISPKYLLRWTLRHLKKIKRLVFQFFTHCVDAGYDLYRYLRYSNAIYQSSGDRQKLETLLFFYYHKIEKAMALPIVKPLFGLSYIETTLDLAEKWARNTNDVEAVVFRGAYAALAQYQNQVQPALSQSRPDIALRLNRFLVDYENPNQEPGLGGTVEVFYGEDTEFLHDINFEQLVRHRHSIRNFIKKPVPDSAIMQAVKIAQRTPSVCNRQCWRVHVFTSPADKAKILQYQNGNEGFGHLADRVILITADLRGFLSSGERHQATIDSGMFAMTLILALEAQGIVSCCLNLCFSAFEENAFRRESGISRWEVPIMLIVIGYPPEHLQVAISARKTTESMLTFHG